MKKFPKTKKLQLRITPLFDAQLNQIAEFLQLDKTDAVRMILSNGVNFWLEKRRSQKVADHLGDGHELQRNIEIAKTRWVDDDKK